jgi:hypothetical protein
MGGTAQRYWDLYSCSWVSTKPAYDAPPEADRAAELPDQRAAEEPAPRANASS